MAQGWAGLCRCARGLPAAVRPGAGRGRGAHAHRRSRAAVLPKLPSPPCSAGRPRSRSSLPSEGRARLMAVAMKLQTLDLSPPTSAAASTNCAPPSAPRSNWPTPRRAPSAPRRSRSWSRSRQELLEPRQGGQPAMSRPAPRAYRGARTCWQEGGAVAMPIVTGLGGKIVVVTSATDGKRLAVIDLPELTTRAAVRAARSGRTNAAARGLDRRLFHQLPGRRRAADSAGRSGWPPSTASGRSSGASSRAGSMPP